MLDKISRTQPTGYTKSAQPVKSEVQAEKGQGVSKPSAEVKLSDEAQFLQKVFKSAQDSPEVRADLVEALKKQVDAGTYKVDYTQLAGKILPYLK